MNMSESLAMLFEIEKVRILVSVFIVIVTIGVAGLIYIGKTGFDRVNKRRKGRK